MEPVSEIEEKISPETRAFMEQYDFRKRIGIDIWKPKKKEDRPYYDIWNRDYHVPLYPET